MKIEWQIFYQDWQNCRDASQFAAAQQIEKTVRQLLNNRKLRDVEWILDAIAVRDDELRTDERAYFIFQSLGRSQQMPNALFEPMLKAAVYDADPSRNRRYIDPCLRCFGRRLVNRRLVDYLKDGSFKEKAGAARAFYWSFQLPYDVVEVEDISDLKAEAKSLMRTEYEADNDPDLQREIEQRMTYLSEPPRYRTNAQILGVWYWIIPLGVLFVILALVILIAVILSFIF